MYVHFASPVHLVKCKWIFGWILQILSITNRKNDWFLTWYINHSGVIIKVNLFIKHVLNIYYRQGNACMFRNDGQDAPKSSVQQHQQTNSVELPPSARQRTLRRRRRQVSAGEGENTEHQSQCWESSPQFFSFKGNWLFKKIFSLKSGGGE